MDATTRRERIKVVVLEQEKVRAEIARLSARRAVLNGELDRLLGESAAPKKAAAAPKVSAPAAKQEKAPAPQKGEKATRRRRKGGKNAAAAAKQPKGKAGPAKAAPKAKGAKAQPKAKGAKAQPTVKDKILAVLSDKAEGVELSAVAKQVYGSDDKDARRKCEQNLYSIAKQKLVTHRGPVWRLLAAA